MIFPIVWTEYTVTVNGRVHKRVPCEGCGVEYVYVLERESTGTAISPYSVPGGAEEVRLASAAEESVQQYLANDFDPVPCPVCGHYQKHMFPKLMETGCLWGVVAPGLLLVAGGLSVVSTVFGAIGYLERPNDPALWRLIGSCAALATVGFLGAGLWAIRRAKVRNFDPNTEDQQTRIAKGQKRAVTRAQFEAGQQPSQGRTEASR